MAEMERIEGIKAWRTMVILETVWEEYREWGKVKEGINRKKRSKTFQGHQNEKVSVDDNVYGNIFD